MIAEISIFPLDRWQSLSKDVAEVVKIIQDSGVAYQLNPMGTVVEGEPEELFELFKRIHLHVRSKSKRVYTLIKIDDKVGYTNLIERKVKSVEEKLSRLQED